MLRDVPARFWHGAILFVVAAVCSVAYFATTDTLSMSASWQLALGGVRVAAVGLLAAGLWELGARLVGPRAVLVRVAAIAIAGRIAISIAWSFVWLAELAHDHARFETLAAASQWVWFVVHWVPVAMMIAAAWHERRVRAVGCVLLLLLVDPAPCYASSLYGRLDLGRVAALVLQHGIDLAMIGMIVVLALPLARGRTTTPEPARAAAGLRRIAAGLWLRVGAALVAVALAFLTSSSHASTEVVRFVAFAGAVTSLVAELVVVLGMLAGARAALDDLSSSLLSAASALTLWCFGVSSSQLPYLWRTLYGHDFALRTDDYAGALASVQPLVATLAIALVAIALGGLASRRGLHALGEHASGKGIGFVGLMLASTGITALVVPTAQSPDGLMTMLVCAGIAALAAQVMMARLCRLGADAIELEPGLPAAKVVSS